MYFNVSGKKTKRINFIRKKSTVNKFPEKMKQVSSKKTFTAKNFSEFIKIKTKSRGIIY